MQVTIRRAVIADVVPLAAIARTTFFDTFAGTCTEADMDGFLEQYFNRQQVEKELANELDYYFLAATTDGICGYVRFMEADGLVPETNPWKALELKRIYVLREFHGSGVAQQLMDFVIRYAIEQEYELLYLGVWEHNLRAQRFYVRNGFVDSGLRHDFPIGSTPQTDRWFWKFLKEKSKSEGKAFEQM